MKLKYSLTPKDFLAYQLYESSKSESSKKKRKKNRIIPALIYILLGAYFSVQDKSSSALILFSFTAIIWYLVYPSYAKWKHKKHFSNHIKEHYQERINKISEITFENDFLISKDAVSEGKIKVVELKELIEAPNHFFLKISIGLSIIIPKEKVANKGEFIKYLTTLGITYIDESKWKWS